MPEQADVFMDHLRKGLANSGRPMSDLDIQVGGSFEVSDDVERLVAARKPAMAFTLGGMGSADTNFYNDAFRRAGYDRCGDRGAGSLGRGQERRGDSRRA